jgi:probable F420-dependent oxidoreductase
MEVPGADDGPPPADAAASCRDPLAPAGALSAGSSPPRLSVRVGVTWSPRAGETVPGALWPVVDALESGGWDSLWLNDTGAPGGVAPLPLLAAVAARTDRLKLGTNVLVLPPRNPVFLARELATVDALSSGRLLPAGGLGVANPREHRAMGVPSGERAARLEESIAIIAALWRGEPVTREGRFWSLEDAVLTPRPSRPKLEFWLGGRAPVALRRIGRIADGWIASFAGPEEFAAGVAVIRTSARDAGRKIDDDHFGTTIHAVREPDGLGLDTERLFALRPDVRPEEHVAHGPEQLRELLGRFIAVGATKFVLVLHARDIVRWIEELRPVIAPLEAAGATAPL